MSANEPIPLAQHNATQTSAHRAMSNDKRGPSADDGLKYVQYDVNKEEVYLDPIRQLIAKDLSGGENSDSRNRIFNSYF